MLPNSDCALQASDINALFGFRLECTERLGEQQGTWAWKRLNSLFNWLPLAATIEERVLCMHGGKFPPLACNFGAASCYTGFATSIFKMQALRLPFCLECYKSCSYACHLEALLHSRLGRNGLGLINPLHD